MIKDALLIISFAYLLQGLLYRWDTQPFETNYYSKRIDPELNKQVPETFEEQAWYYVNYSFVWVLRQPLYVVDYWNAISKTIIEGVSIDYWSIKNKLV